MNSLSTTSAQTERNTNTYYCESYSLDTIIESFRAAMAKDGMVVEETLLADGVLHRCYVIGDKRGKKNGAYVIHANGTPAGWFGNWRTGLTRNWSITCKRVPMTAAIRKQIEDEKHNRELEHTMRHAAAAKVANHVWGESKLIAKQSEHPYLVRKCVQPNGLRVYKGKLIVPIYNDSGELVNYEGIKADGSKKGLPDGEKKGCFSKIGEFGASSKTILICEGWATGASLHEAYGHFVVITFGSGNIMRVAKNIRSLYPDAEIIVAGDNDDDVKNGPGRKAAKEAALAVKGKYLIPDIPGYDWNDVLSSRNSNG